MTVIATLLSRFRRVLLPAVLAVAAAVVVGPSRTAHAVTPQRLAVLPGSGRNVSAAVIWRARDALVKTLGQIQWLTVVDMDRNPTVDPPPPMIASWIAASLQATTAVAFDIAHQVGQTTLTATCIDVPTARVTCSLTETTAAGPQAAPDLASRLAGRLMTELGIVPVVAGASSAPPSPRWVHVGAHATLLMPMVSFDSSPSVLSGWGLSVGIDRKDLLLDLTGEYTSADRYRVWGAGLGVLVPLGRDEWTPYLGMRGFWVRQQLARGATGAQLRPTLGLMWGRTGGAGVRAEVGYFIDLFGEQAPDRLFPGSDRYQTGHGFVFSMGASL